jgi:hypothetical protein
VCSALSEMPPSGVACVRAVSDALHASEPSVDVSYDLVEEGSDIPSLVAHICSHRLNSFLEDGAHPSVTVALTASSRFRP